MVNRLKVLPNISQVDVKVTNLFSAHIQQQSHSDSERAQNINIAKLGHMLKNISLDNGVLALCRECLAQNNNNPDLALESLRAAFYRAGVGTVSERIRDVLIRESLVKNVDEIQAFGRKRIVDVAQFLKSLPQTANGAIDLAKMIKIGQGGTQDVFVLKDTPSAFVIKVNRASIKMESIERVEKYKTDNAAYKALHDSFGDHCTVEQLLLRNVADNFGTKEAIISVADFEVGFKKESKVGLQDSDFSLSDVAVVKHLDAYDNMIKSMFFADGTSTFDQGALEVMSPKVVKIANLIRQEPAFKDALKEFLHEFKEYFDKTGQYLDIAGQDNIIFFRNDGGWTFKLGTVIKEETAKKFGECLNWLKSGSKEVAAPKNHMSILRYCFHWTKTLNTLAMMVGMNRVIDDANVKHVVDVWDEIEKAGITGKPSDPKRFLEILHAVEVCPANKLLHEFKALSVNPEKEADILLAILSDTSPDKKMVLAQYLHRELPKADGSGGQGADYRFCYVRFHIGMDIAKIPEGKALALECFREVIMDPDGPHAEVQQAIKNLL